MPYMAGQNLSQADEEHPPTEEGNRLRIDFYRRESVYEHLAEDVRSGLASPPRSLPCKYFYDELGSELFDQICDLPEYYLTRTEEALLESVAEEIVVTAQPQNILELGSGTSRKTRVLLDAVFRKQNRLRYLPVDVSHSTLRTAAHQLLDSYSGLSVHALAADYEKDLHRIPHISEALIVFLGSTIGNFSPDQADQLLTRLRERSAPGSFFLLGVDLVKGLCAN